MFSRSIGLQPIYFLTQTSVISNKIINDSSLKHLLLFSRQSHLFSLRNTSDSESSAGINKQLKSLFHSTRILSQVEREKSDHKILSSLVESNQEPSQISTHVTGAKRGILYELKNSKKTFNQNLYLS